MPTPEPHMTAPLPTREETVDRFLDEQLGPRQPAPRWPLRSRAHLPTRLGAGLAAERIWQRLIWLAPSPVFCARRLYDRRCDRVRKATDG